LSAEPDKPRLVLLHGWGIGRGAWDGVTPALGERFEVLVLDLPGYRNTADLADHSLTAAMQWLADRVPVGSHAMGWSLGGQLLCQLALHRPAHLASLVTIASSPRFVAEEDWPGVDAALLGEFQGLLSHDPTALLKRFCALASAGDGDRRVLKRLRAIVSAQAPPPVASLAAGLRWLEAIDYRQALQELRVPRRHIFAADDALVPVAVARTTGNAVTLPGGHAPMLSVPDRLLAALDEFYRRPGVVA
jgi:pimeloyl-[acyl-carrier protein] methyl ester esterase